MLYFADFALSHNVLMSHCQTGYRFTLRRGLRTAACIQAQEQRFQEANAFRGELRTSRGFSLVCDRTAAETFTGVLRKTKTWLIGTGEQWQNILGKKGK